MRTTSGKMWWKFSIHLLYAIIVIEISEGQGQQLIETHIVPEHVVTTPAAIPCPVFNYKNDDHNNIEAESEVTKEPDHEATNIADLNETPLEIDDNTENTPTSVIDIKPNSRDVPKNPEIGNRQDKEAMSRVTESMEFINEVILTEHGPVVGFYLHEATGIRSYIDIPYGSVTGRFAAPETPAAWEDIHQVSAHDKRCPQIQEDDTYVGDLDCLTLSVFALSDVENAPVLFHIHDGDFLSGSGDPSVYGPDYLVSKGVILVLPNYRLGPLGFLCLQNDIIPGNAALKDLTLALQWTVNNIGLFGGDALNIAVSGEGTAGALAGLLALSPISSAYINKVITESGSILAPWALDRNPIDTAAKLAESLKNNITTELDLETLVRAAKDLDIKPCVERGTEAFMKETPWQMLRNVTNIDITFMIGSANYAGMQEALEHNIDSLDSISRDFSLILPEDLNFRDQDEKQVISDQLRKIYFEDNTITTNDVDQLSLYYTDASYLGPSIRYARSLAQLGATVFFYEFSFVGEMNRELDNLETDIKGAARGDIIGYAFTQNGEVAQPGTEEEKMVDLVTDLWVSFLRNGYPSAAQVEWNKIGAETEEEWLSIDSEPTVHQGLYLDRIGAWSEIYNNHYVESNLASGLKPPPAPCSAIIVALISLYLQNKAIAI